MKFIHLSDLHLLPGQQTVQGIDPHARLEAAVASICDEFPDAELCMVTGDLTDEGDEASYKDARRILDRLPCPWHGMMGNHDGRQSQAQAALPDLPWQADGSLQYAFDTSAGRFIALDSSASGTDGGRLSPARLAYLREQLEVAKSAGKDAFLFMHHPPFSIGIKWLDDMKLENSDAFWDVLKDFDNIRHMFFGHIHRPTHGTWHGIPVSTVRATAHQVKLRFDDAPPEFTTEDPSFAVVLVGDDQVIIHDHTFLKTPHG